MPHERCGSHQFKVYIQCKERCALGIESLCCAGLNWANPEERAAIAEHLRMAGDIVHRDLAALTDPGKREALLPDAKRIAARRFVCDLAVARDKQLGRDDRERVRARKVLALEKMADRLEEGTALSSEYRSLADVHLDDAFARAREAATLTEPAFLAGPFGGLELIARHLARSHTKITAQDMTTLVDLVAKAREIPVGVKVMTLGEDRCRAFVRTMAEAMDEQAARGQP